MISDEMETTMKSSVDRRGQFDVSDIDPRLIIQAAFMGSRPQGLGFLHHKPGGLTEAELDEIVERGRDDGSIHIDYLRGRSMKFHLCRDRENQRLYFDLDWYDHGRFATEQLMRDIDLPDVEERIAEARAGKKAKEDEWAAAELTAAKTALRLVSEGQTTRPDDYFKLEFEDPIYQAWSMGTDRAIREGWLTISDDFRSYSVTDAGRALKETTDAP